MYSRVNTSHSIFQQFYTRDIPRPNEKSLSIPEQPTISSAKNFSRMKIGKIPLKKPRYIWNIDGTHNKSGSIKEYVDLQVQVGPKKEEMRFLVTHIGEDELVLGYPWLAAFQP